MASKVENAVEELIFEIAEELELSDADAQRIDVPRITGTVLSSLRRAVMDDVGLARGDDALALPRGVADSIRRLAKRLRRTQALGREHGPDASRGPANETTMTGEEGLEPSIP